ncbi:efflux RND transporter periplasmic adaptor subunit [Arachidicoccus ginsenosidivorans]|jgi:membrane fusion protein (multidrug efflux system)|uniref:Efflux RND transporter periplasmic adaptor subunit n=1 Tax=Arachidicoccus ginsenosidivorans TaxID=496057 RepID=A0A5B8VIB2_9BACT|nr:efflux RND transporter periplasmic adaptor subunit [Arachidicoccus ginsenosidivorans]QEC70735.1 efflux RND transporter periplasmic adaptor subunit [Arachidicoccus ginsenosidivorans]
MRSFSLLFCTCILLSVVACKSKAKKSHQVTNNTYPVITLKSDTATLYADYPGTIQGIENVEIRPKIDGFISGIYVDEGASVDKGQLLFKIDAPQYEQDVRTAKANINIAKADVDAAVMNVNKVKPLVEKGIISDYELKSAKFTLEAKKAALSQAEATLENAKINLSYTSIYSPVSGVIGILPFKVGSLVGSGTATALTTVSNISQIYCYFSINEKQELDFFASAKGNTIQEKLSTLPPAMLVLSNGSVFSHRGKVQSASGFINAQTGAVNLRAVFPNPNGIIRNGSSAVVRLPTTIADALLIPQKATYQIQGALFVYKVDKDNKVSSVSISVNSSNNGKFYVVKSGLKPGDRIVADGIDNLRENLVIEPKMVTLQQSISE